MENDQALEEQSAEDRMQALLDREEEQDQQTDEPEEAQEAEPEEGQEPEEEEKSQPEPARVKLKWNGEEVEKDLNEVIELAQQGYDYTKKTQTVAEERKAIEAQTQAIKAQEKALEEQAQIQQALVKEFGKLTAIDESLSQYANIDWGALTDSDSVQAQKLFYQYSQLKNNREKAIQELNHKHAHLTEQKQSRQRELIAKGLRQLHEAIPGWNAEKAGEVTSTGKDIGFTDNELSQIADPRMVKALWEAAQYRKLQSSKPQIQNKVAGKPPVVKPGSKDSSAGDRSKVRELKQNLSKRGRIEDAAKLIERTL